MNWMLSESTETGIGSVGTYRQGVCNGQLAVIKAGSEGKPLISQASNMEMCCVWEIELQKTLAVADAAAATTTAITTAITTTTTTTTITAIILCDIGRPIYKMGKHTGSRNQNSNSSVEQDVLMRCQK